MTSRPVPGRTLEFRQAWAIVLHTLRLSSPCSCSRRRPESLPRPHSSKSWARLASMPRIIGTIRARAAPMMRQRPRRPERSVHPASAGRAGGLLEGSAKPIVLVARVEGGEEFGAGAVPAFVARSAACATAACRVSWSSHAINTRAACGPIRASIAWSFCSSAPTWDPPSTRKRQLLLRQPPVCREKRGDDRNRTGVDGFAARCTCLLS